MNFCQLLDDIYTELMKHMSTYQMRKLMTVNQKMNSGPIGAEVRKRVAERKLYSQYTVNCYRKATELFRKNSSGSIIADLIHSIKKEMFNSNNRIYGIQWTFGPSDLYLESDKNKTSEHWREIIRPHNYRKREIYPREQKYLCLCVRVLSISSQKAHTKTKVHNDYMIQYCKDNILNILNTSVAIQPGICDNFKHNWKGYFTSNSRFDGLKTTIHTSICKGEHFRVELQQIENTTNQSNQDL
jgi:hypothetical protein